MADKRPPRRLFSEKEVSRVLKRATELQAVEGSAETTGLSLEELQQIADEVGIDPRHLVVALAELEQGDDGGFHWLGAPTTVDVERVVEGEVSEQQWERMVQEIRQEFDLVGGAGRVGRSFEWTRDSSDKQAQVTVTPHEGQTTIQIHLRFPDAALQLYFWSLAAAAALGGFIGGGLDLPGLQAFFVMISAVIVAFLGLRFVFKGTAKKKERQARDLLARLEQIVAEPAQEAAPLPEATARLDASLLVDEAEPEEAPVQAQTRDRASS